jgi:putative ABC transport system permease protein
MSAELARRLNVGVGDPVTAEVLEGSRPAKELTVTGIIDEMMGLNAYMEIGALNRVMNEDDVISGAYLAVDPDKQEKLYSFLKQMPHIAGVGLPAVILKGFNDTFARTIGMFTFFLVLFSSAIVFGVVYNAARIALTERGRELASLRVLGFTKGEISQILFGEQAVLTVLAIPFGYLIGYTLCYTVNNLTDREIMRLPLVFSDRTFVLTALIVAAATVLSSFVVSLRLRSLDLIEVLKTRE